jgi:hypothetical protein
MLANGAPRDNAWALNVHMHLGKASGCAAIRTLPFCSRHIRREYFAQFSGGNIAVKVVICCAHLRSPVEPKRSVLIFSRWFPAPIRRSVAFSTNDVGPQT